MQLIKTYLSCFCFVVNVCLGQVDWKACSSDSVRSVVVIGSDGHGGILGTASHVGDTDKSNYLVYRLSNNFIFEYYDRIDSSLAITSNVCAITPDRVVLCAAKKAPFIVEYNVDIKKASKGYLFPGNLPITDLKYCRNGLLMATVGGVLYESTNNGKTWNYNDRNYKVAGEILFIEDGHIILSGGPNDDISNAKELLSSTDFGRSWSQLDSSLVVGKQPFDNLALCCYYIDGRLFVYSMNYQYDEQLSSFRFDSKRVQKLQKRIGGDKRVSVGSTLAGDSLGNIYAYDGWRGTVSISKDTGMSWKDIGCFYLKGTLPSSFVADSVKKYEYDSAASMSSLSSKINYLSNSEILLTDAMYKCVVLAKKSMSIVSEKFIRCDEASAVISGKSSAEIYLNTMLSNNVELYKDIYDSNGIYNVHIRLIDRDRSGFFSLECTSQIGAHLLWSDTIHAVKRLAISLNRSTVKGTPDSLRLNGAIECEWYRNGEKLTLTDDTISAISRNVLLVVKNGNYYCDVFDVNGCIGRSDTLQYFINEIEGEKPPSENITIMPNPADGHLNILGNDENSIVAIYDIYGRICKKESKSTIDTSDLAPGVYKCLMSANNINTSKQFLILR